MPTRQDDNLTYVDRLKAAGLNEFEAWAHTHDLDRALRAEIATAIVELRASPKSNSISLLPIGHTKTTGPRVQYFAWIVLVARRLGRVLRASGSA